MAQNKRELIAELIEAGGATKESLMEAAEVNAAGLSSQFTYLRLTGRFPVKGDDGVYKFIPEAEWNKMKEEAASRKVSGGPKKSPEERKEALEKRVEKLRDAFVCVNAVEETSAVADFQGEVTFPAAFSWRDVDQDSRPGVSGFTNGDYRDITGELQSFLCYA